MPPRIPIPQGLSPFTLCLRSKASTTAQSLQPLIQKATLTRQEKKRMMKQEPYKWAQIQARKAILVKRQDEVIAERKAKWGDPVRGFTTPFVESFDSAGQTPLSTPKTDGDGNSLGESHELPTSPHLLNHFLTKAELDVALEMGYQLAKPLQEDSHISDPVAVAEQLRQHEENHKKAVTALQRITALSSADGGGRMRANVRRCIEEFGRHNTDLTLRPKPVAPELEDREVVPRAGPDTGSSEVQIAILTAKIRSLAASYETRKGYKDKHNRRNLRLLCHRRQRLMKYMERKERGGERWTNMLEKLGLSQATWQKQIAV